MGARDLPIPFTADMVDAVLSDVRPKTQTRRLVRLPRHLTDACRLDVVDGKVFAINTAHPEAALELRCPYGEAGTKLWVRERYAFAPRWDSYPPSAVPEGEPRWYFEAAEQQKGLNPRIGKWRPGMFMPRWVSRINLEVLAVRVERLQHISTADAISEGCNPAGHLLGEDSLLVHQLARARLAYPDGAQARMTTMPYPMARYAALWDSINRKTQPWASNPWVWVIDFKRL